MRTFLSGLALLLASGCATVGTVQTARPIAERSVQVGLEPGVWGVEGRGWVPAANVAVRYGLTRWWDVGARLGVGGLGVSTKFALTDPYEQRLAVALAPSVSGFGLGLLGIGTKSIHGQVPLIVGVGIGREHELILAPKVTAWQLSGSAGVARASSLLVGAGGTVGLSLRVGRNVRLVPEVGLVQPIFGRANAKVLFWDIDARQGVPLYQATFGILLGGER